jgi:tRNA A-37 threonylcarbamoyl transferase component Bud32
VTEIMANIDAATLSDAARSLTLPACLDVQLNDQSPMERLELLRFFRVLPGKRVVCLARWRDQLVVAKIFLSPKGWKRHLLRETNGITVLLSEGIPTPKIAGIGTSADAQAGVLLLEYLDQSQSIRKGWKNSSLEERERMLRSVVRLIAQCHSRGLLQHDIHLDNFVMQQQQLFLLDAADVEKRDEPNDVAGVDNLRSMQNLALFFAQFPVFNDRCVPQMYEYYRKLRPEAQLSADIALFNAILRKKRLGRVAVVENKLYRSSTANVCKRSWNKFVVYRRKLESPAWQAFIENPDDFIAAGTCLKNGNSSTVALVDIDNKPYVVKRYNLKSPWHFLRRMFRPSRAWVSWRNAHVLRLLGIATPAPRLMMEKRYGFLRGRAYFVSKFTRGENVLQSILEAPINSPIWHQALDQFGELFEIMNEYGVVHGDTKATNFILGKKRLKVLDLDAMYMEQDRARFQKAFQKDLLRFADNWQSDTQKHQQVLELLKKF